jgi:chromosome segregation ATPase
MQRIHAPFDEPTLAQIDREVEKKGISRAQWLSSVVGAYLRLLELSKGADPGEMLQEMAQLRLNNESLWKENQQLKRAEEKARIGAEQVRRKLGSLEEQGAATMAELEKARSDLLLLQRDFAHYQDTIKLKDQEISFLQAQTAQLIQSISQLSLPPSQEEAKRKRWYQFWRRG